MKAAFLTETGFDLREIPLPDCGPGKVLVKTAVCGICDGDVSAYKAARTSSGQKERLLGHEANGTICRVGAGVQGFKPGDRVASLSGAYADYFVASPAELSKIPDGLSFEEALGEPIACYVHAAGRFGIQKGDRVAVLGCGFMGLGCVQMAKLAGALEVRAFDPIDWRRAKALEVGATHAEDPRIYTDNAGPVNERFDVVIEATGVQNALDLATVMVKEHGKIIIVGYHYANDGRRDINMKVWNWKAIDVINGHVRREDEKKSAMERGLTLVTQRKLEIKSIAAYYPFDRIQSAFEDLLARKIGLFKAVLKFSDPERE